MPTLVEDRNLVEWAQQEPVEWLEASCGIQLWEAQREIACSVRDNRYTVVWACHAPGKTFGTAHVATWFLYAFPHCKVLLTAPTYRQVSSLLWSEIRTAHARAYRRGTELGGYPKMNPRLELGPDWFLEGFSSPEWDTERVQGYHGENILVVADEASGVPDTIFDALEGLMAGGHARMVLIGNPNKASGRFYEATSNPLFNKIHIPAWKTPNFTEPGITREDIISGEWERKAPDAPAWANLIKPLWVSERAKSWGVNSLLWRVRVEALFPESGGDADAVIPGALILEAQAKDFAEDEKEAPVELGVDVARYGDDETVIAIRAGRAALKEVLLHQQNTMAVTGAIIQECRDVGWERVEKIKVDVIGLGAAPVDRLKELQAEGLIPKHVAIVGVNVGRRPRDPKRFVTHRDEVWWSMRELLQSGGAGGAGFSDEAIRELSAPKYTLLSRSQIRVEPKESLRKSDRLGRSPDRADAWILAFVDCIDEMPPRRRARASSLRRPG